MDSSNMKSESQVISDMLLLVVEVISEFHTVKCTPSLLQKRYTLDRLTVV